MQNDVASRALAKELAESWYLCLMTHSLDAAITLQAQIEQYRRLAASNQLRPGLARLLRDLADDVLARARQLDQTGQADG